MDLSLTGSLLADGFFAAVAAIGFAVISNPPKKAVFVSALLAAVGHACRYYLIQYTPLDLTPSTFVASFVIGLLSLLFAKMIHCPAEVFSFPSLLPMIPGMFAYKTVLSLMRFLTTSNVQEMQGLLIDVFRNGLTTIFVLFALVVGVSLPLFMFHRQSFMMTRLLHRKLRRPGVAQ